MSHIHFPDGVLPVWLWVSGFIVAILIGVILFRFNKEEDLSRRLPLLGMMAALMVLGASFEIVPIAYHVNLTVISGILLGPSLIFLATLVVNVILALFGHGGITVIGLNTLTLSLEGILGYVLFRLMWRLGTSHFEELIHQEGKGIFEFHLSKEKPDQHDLGKKGGKVNLKRFMAIVLPLGFIGWVLEGVITSLIARYIHRLRPDLLGLDNKAP
jgi:cobalt/nickel transport system permease protein